MFAVNDLLFRSFDANGLLTFPSFKLILRAVGAEWDQSCRRRPWTNRIIREHTSLSMPDFRLSRLQIRLMNVASCHLPVAIVRYFRLFHVQLRSKIYNSPPIFASNKQVSPSENTTLIRGCLHGRRKILAQGRS